MSYKNICLKRGKEESLLRFHPWVFSGAIEKTDEGIEEGELVRVIAKNGQFIGIGHYQIGDLLPFASYRLKMWILIKPFGKLVWLQH